MRAAEDPFRIRAHVPAFDTISEEYRMASDASRRRWRTESDIAYGSSDAERLDLYFPGRTGGRLPIHMFLHGGYWRANRKEDYGFLADTICASGGIAAIVEYALMPGARMATLVDQVRRAAQWLAAHADKFGGDAGRLSASGHSAGAHLAVYLVASGPHECGPAQLTPLRSLLLVSGIYDLGPITRSFLQAEIGLTQDEVGAWSPLQARVDPGTSVVIIVGEEETPPFLAQAAAFAHQLRLRQVNSEIRSMPGLDHMTIVRELGTPGSAAAEMLVRSLGPGGANS